jgi:hypothetical protein
LLHIQNGRQRYRQPHLRDPAAINAKQAILGPRQHAFLPGAAHNSLHRNRPSPAQRNALKSALPMREKPRRSADPKRAIVIHHQLRNGMTQRRRSIRHKRPKAHAIKARQPAIGANPKKSIGSLRNGSNKVLRQTLLCRPCLQNFALKLPALRRQRLRSSATKRAGPQHPGHREQSRKHRSTLATLVIPCGQWPAPNLPDRMPSPSHLQSTGPRKQQRADPAPSQF